MIWVHYQFVNCYQRLFWFQVSGDMQVSGVSVQVSGLVIPDT